MQSDASEPARPFVYRIRRIILPDGNAVSLSSLTIFVGANNSGKSRVLKDLLACATTAAPNNVVLRQVHFELPKTVTELLGSYSLSVDRDQNLAYTLRYLRPDFTGEGAYGFGNVEWPEGISPAGLSPHQLATMFGASLVAFLTTAQRLHLVEEGTLNRMSRATLLQELYHRGPSTERVVREAVHQAFPATKIALDYSEPPKVEWRIVEDWSKIPEDSRLAHGVFEKCPKLDDQGDGLRSYAGIVTAMMCTSRPVVLIDEPEAFLHPPQAYRIGQFIASMAAEDKQIIVATHSVDVLRGLLSKTNDPKVIHLARTGNTTRFSIQEKSDLVSVLSDPLLSAAGVLNGLFFSGVVVTEADADTRFYSALSTSIDGNRDLHFVNADNKQTIPKVISSYVKMGVAAVGIVDIDVINDAIEFAQHLDGLKVAEPDRTIAIDARARIEVHIKAQPLGALLQDVLNALSQQVTLVSSVLGATPAEHESALKNLRAELGALREKAGVWSPLKKLGTSILGRATADFDTVTNILAKYRVLVNPLGELEASLVHLGLAYTSNKKKWFRDAMPLLAKLPVNAKLQPWKIIADAHARLDLP